MNGIKTQTGKLLDSNIKNCLVFIPNLISSKLYKQVLIDKTPLTSKYIKYEKVLSFYMWKFLAGDKNMHIDYADIPIEELYLWNEAKICDSPVVKTVCSAINRFERAYNKLVKLTKLEKDNLISINIMLNPKKFNKSLRRKDLIVGNPKTNPNAFYCIPSNLINFYLHDFLNFLNKDNFKAIDKALIALQNFIFIHPFQDGNGRLSRLILLKIIKNEYGIIYASLLAIYLKNINRNSYHNAVNTFQKGDVKTLKKFHDKAVSWTNKSIKVLNDLLREYEKLIVKNELDSDECYKQIIIKTPIKSAKKLDPSIFQEQGKKGSNSIYINTALLNVLNQFDYYLRFELRTCMMENQ